ncbi:MAG: HAD-IA family hydrolase [Pseudomonadota bacterium]
MPRALIWDVDGTLAETERDGHRVAFNSAFEAAGLPWRWDVDHYGRLLQVTGGRERLLHDMALRPDAPASAAGRELLARTLHALKNAAYARLVAQGQVSLRPGVRELLDECAAAGVRLAIATTTSRSNVQALLQAQLGDAGAPRFEVVLCAEDAPRKKPDPQVYRLALQALGLAARDAVAVEDSPAGLAAARASGIPVLLTRSVYFANAFQPPGAADGVLAIGDGLHSGQGWSPAASAPGRIGLTQLKDWLKTHPDNMRCCA